MATVYLPYRDCVKNNQGYIQYSLNEMKLGSYEIDDSDTRPEVINASLHSTKHIRISHIVFCV